MSRAAWTRTASFSRRRMRFRTTAFPTFLVTVMPRRGSPASSRRIASNRKSRPRRFSPRRTARNWARFFKRPGAFSCGRSVKPFALRRPARDGLSGQTLAAAGAAGSDDLLASLGGHARTETVAALADEFGRLVGALHLFNTAACGPSWIAVSSDEEHRPVIHATTVAPRPGPERGAAYRKIARPSQSMPVTTR
jgi:hypothetical protein